MSGFPDPALLRETGLLDGPMLAALLAVALGGALRGFTGFGGAMAIVPVLAILFTPREAVAMHAVMEIPGVLQLLPTAVRQADRGTVLPMIAALIAAVPVGVWLLLLVDQDLMRAVISLMVLLMVALLAGNWRYGGPSGRPVSFAVGAAGGVVQGSTGIGGPPIVLMLLALNDAADTMRANVIAMMGSLTLIALPVLWAYGLLSVRVLLVGAISAPVYFGAIYLGSRYYAGGGKALYRRISLATLTVIALSTLAAALFK